MNLIIRTCKCGCGNTWKCLETSTNWYFSKTHDPTYKSKATVVLDEKSLRLLQRIAETIEDGEV